MNQGQKPYYCDSPDCRSRNKIIKTAQDIVEYHNHLPKFRTFDNLRDELIKEKHPLRGVKMNPQDDEVYLFIDEGVNRLIESFAIIANNLKHQIKCFVSYHIVPLEDLNELFKAVIDRNYDKIEEFQHLIPKLLITQQDIIIQEGKSKIVQKKVFQVIQELNDQVQNLQERIDFTLRDHPQNNNKYKWSSFYKHAWANIIGATVSNTTKNAWYMNLLDPAINMTDVTKVRLRIVKLSQLMISLCDVNIAKNKKATWDYRNSPGEGTYSHYQDGGIMLHKLNLEIYAHHLEPNQTNAQVLAFTFKEGDILELEWNGPLKQFITSRPATKDTYIQSVDFNQNAELHFGVQLAGSTVELIYSE